MLTKDAAMESDFFSVAVCKAISLSLSVHLWYLCFCYAAAVATTASTIAFTNAPTKISTLRLPREHPGRRRMEGAVVSCGTERSAAGTAIVTSPRQRS